MSVIKINLSALWITVLTFTATAGTPKIITLLDRANLVTISALCKVSVPRDIAVQVSALPQQVVANALLIAESGEAVEGDDARRGENALYNSFEKFALVSKGILTTENPLGAQSYEIVITEDGTSGKMALYKDAAHRTALALMRWRKLDNATEFVCRSFENNQVKETVVTLGANGDGSFTSSVGKNKQHQFKWNNAGTVETDYAAK